MSTEMLTVAFERLDLVDDSLLEYAVIVSRYQGLWIYCKHKARETWEIPGGHREPGEGILFTARRELYEETGALDFEIFPICAYTVTKNTRSYGFLCYADIKKMGELPASEIERIRFFKDEHEALTYPAIQPLLFEKVNRRIDENNRFRLFT